MNMLIEFFVSPFFFVIFPNPWGPSVSELSTHAASKSRKKTSQKLSLFRVAVVTPAITDVGWHETWAKEDKQEPKVYLRMRSERIQRARASEM